jgi:hypothetical protein
MKIVKAVCVGSFICLLSGCTKIIEWGKSSFTPAQDIPINKKTIKPFVKGITVYDELDTVAKFDALWLSDAVRTEYARLHAYAQGKSDEFYQALLRRQLEENKHFITFYILSLYDAPLGDADSAWHFFLQVDGKNIAPSEIKSIDLLPEYKTFFGAHLTRFRAPYRVMFDARDIDDNDILTPETKNLDLIFRSADKEFSLHWDYVSSVTKVSEPVLATPNTTITLDPDFIADEKTVAEPEKPITPPVTSEEI